MHEQRGDPVWEYKSADASLYRQDRAFFFHYTNADAAFRHILPSKELRLSPYSRMADPLESKEWLFNSSFLRGDDEDARLQRHADLGVLINQAKDATKVLSLSVDADGYRRGLVFFGRGYARANMWQLYAENHAGVCLIFDQQELSAALRPQLETVGPTFEGRVDYQKGGLVELGLAPRSFGPAPSSGDDQADIEQHIAQHHQALFFTKLADWSSEWEYRFIVVGQSNDYLQCSIGRSLKAVVLGERFPDWQREGARRVCERAGADLLRLEWGSFRPLLLTA